MSATMSPEALTSSASSIQEPVDPAPAAFTSDSEKSGGQRVSGDRLRSAFLELVAKIESYRLLAEDWDGELSPSIDEAATRRALEFIGQLRDMDWLPWVAPTTDGGVRIEWDAGMAFVSVEFISARDVEVMFRPDQVSQTEFWTNEEIPEDLAPLVRRVHQARATTA